MGCTLWDARIDWTWFQTGESSMLRYLQATPSRHPIRSCNLSRLHHAQIVGCFRRWEMDFDANSSRGRTLLQYHDLARPLLRSFNTYSLGPPTCTSASITDVSSRVLAAFSHRYIIEDLPQFIVDPHHQKSGQSVVQLRGASTGSDSARSVHRRVAQS